MESTHSILVSVDDETHRRARIRADELQLSVPQLAATAPASAVETVDHSQDAPEEVPGGDQRGLDDLIQRIRAAHPAFRPADNLSRNQLYERVGRAGR